MRCAILAALLLGGLAACDGAVPSGQEPNGPIRTGGNESEPASPEAAGGGETEQNAAPGFIGTWAATTTACDSSPWNLTDTGLQTPAGSACSFNRVTEVPGGWDIQATCTAKAPPSSDEIRIRLGNDGQSMRLESETIGSARLELCDREV